MKDQSSSWIWQKVYKDGRYVMMHIDTQHVYLGVVDDFGRLVLVSEIGAMT